MLKRILGYFLSGLALILPLLLTVWLLYYVYSLVAQYLNMQYAGIGVGIMIIGLVTVGYLAASYFGGKMFMEIESTLIKTPLLGPLYKSTKDVTSAFVGAENKFSEPVLVQFVGGVYKLGFVTNKENEHLRNQNNQNQELLYSVYFPLSFSLSGDLYLVPIDKIQPVNKKAKEVMQIIVSGGLLKVDDKNMYT